MPSVRAAHPQSGLPDLYGLTPGELEETLLSVSRARYHGRQLARWLYRKGARDFAEMTDLSKDLRRELAARFRVGRPDCVEKQWSSGREAAKYVLALSDGRRVESVLLRNKDQRTVCVSSQVGCALACSFCATGRIGFLRHLTAGEIVSQVAEVGSDVPDEAPAFNIVLMGMGEPLENYDSVLKAIRLLAEPGAFNTSPRRVTVSTAGLVPQIRMLSGEGMRLGLAVSLNATTDRLRSALMPINRKYPLRVLMTAIRHYAERTGRRVTLEYVLLKGVNDSAEDAARLGRLSRSAPTKVNLIRFNPHEGSGFTAPTEAEVDAFARLLLPVAPAVTVRRSRGDDIAAACGQLVAGFPMRASRRAGAVS